MSSKISGQMYEHCGMVRAEQELLAVARSYDGEFGGEAPCHVDVPSFVAENLDGKVGFEAIWQPGDGSGVGETIYTVSQTTWPIHIGYTHAYSMGFPEKMHRQLRGKLLVWHEQEYRIEPEQLLMTAKRQLCFSQLTNRGDLMRRPIYRADMTSQYEPLLNPHNRCSIHLGDIACAAQAVAGYWELEQGRWDAERIVELLDGGYGDRHDVSIVVG